MTEVLFPAEVEKVVPFPISIRDQVDKALFKVPKEAPFVIMARKDTKQMFIAARINNGDISFGGYLAKEYQKKMDYGVEVVWTPNFF